VTTLVAFGCSHTYGTMLDGKQSSSLFNYHNNYAGLIAKQNNFKYENYALPGGSNECIFRTGLDWLTRIKKRNEDYVVLVGWTSPFRMELRYPQDSEHFHSTMTKGDKKYFPISLGQEPEIATSKDFKRIHSLTPLLFEETKDNDYWATYAYGLQQAFKKHKVNYFMFNTCVELKPTFNNRHVVEALDINKYHKPLSEPDCFVSWGLNQGFKKTECWHLKLDAHIEYSKLITNQLKTLGYF